MDISQRINLKVVEFDNISIIGYIIKYKIWFKKFEIK